MLHSFDDAGVRIVDHHTATEQFAQFERNEAAANRQVTGDRSWLLPPMSAATTHVFDHSYETTVETPTVTAFEDGDTFSFDGTELEVVHTSGHADGLCIFECGQDVLSGDALLPVYTPNVGGADVRVDRPLEKYLRALRNVVDADYARAWPGHREPIEDPAGRAAYIIRHHEERAWRVLDALRRLGPCTTWEVSAELFGELNGIHILHGPGESHAHLEHLERSGTVEVDGGVYRLADGTEGKLAALDETRWDLTY